ncbi:MAG: cytochrome P450 [Cyanobacteria bacterium Co-bin13]|nr:cytochrome P450 [Cyanobacteria bacterium Co-bin13]
MVSWILTPLDLMKRYQQRYGDTFKINLGRLQWVTISHPEALRYVLTHDSQEISAPGELNQIFQSLLGPNSVILLDGEKHRQRRQVVMPPFHGERLKTYAELIQAVARDAMVEDRPSGAIAPLTPGTPFLARDLMQKITMRVILRAVFGLYEGERYQQLEEILRTWLNMFSRPIVSTLLYFPALQQDWGKWSPGGKIAALSAATDRLLYAEIAERRANPNPTRTDILSLLLAMRDETGQGLSDEELHDELMTLLVAGHETTATALTWALYWTHRLPQVKQTLLQELSAEGTEDPLTLTKLPYLSALCNETLRIYPVGMVTFPRRVEQPIEIMGYGIEPGTILLGSIYLLHHRPDLYPEPDQFRPERFLERQYSAYEFMPFGSGTRRCVGAALAMYELKIVLGTLLSEFDFTLAETQPVIPQRRGLTLGQRGGVQMVFNGKRSQVAPALV